jgi:hypothetical protein
MQDERDVCALFYRRGKILVHNPKEHVVEISRRMARRWSANTAGGNISLREEDQVYISPRFALDSSTIIYPIGGIVVGALIGAVVGYGFSDGRH